MLSPAKPVLWFCALFLSAGFAFADDNDVAIAIVYDTSGSMNDPVKGKGASGEAKYVIANRALGAIVARLEKFAQSGGRKVQAGLFVFENKGPKEVVRLGPFDPAAVRAWITGFSRPVGGTPLGTAVADAARALMKTKAGARHVLVITDGENTVGPLPEALLPKVLDDAMKQSAPVYFHFVAFDVDARVFAGVRKLGATLVSAANESQLNDKLGFILDEKILLEKE
ncbi:MAG: vWA domain-containing protein [Chthoniobacteraceae bacterium]